MSNLNRKGSILFLASLRPGCGNTSTARRIVDHLINSQRYIVDCVSVDDHLSVAEHFLKLIDQYDFIFALHAYRAGRILVKHYEMTEKRLPPLIIIFAGTDLHSCEPSWIPTLEKLLPRAQAFVCFSQTWKNYVETFYQNIISVPIFVIPQSVLMPTNPSVSNDLCHQIRQRNKILWIGEIRTVKDPLFALNIISSLNIDEFHLILIGFNLDSTLYSEIQSRSSKTNVTLLGGQPHSVVQNLMKQSFVYLNTSVNEGMSLTILEAMALGLPVVVRSNIGNQSIVEHRKTGFIFDTVEQAVEQLQTLDYDQHLREDFIQRAMHYVQTYHNSFDEQKAYVRLLDSFKNKNVNID